MKFSNFLYHLIFVFVLLSVWSIMVLVYVFADPDSKLTPGVAEPKLTKVVLCAPGFRTGPWRNVPIFEKKQVMSDYNLVWSEHGKYEFDHLIPLEIGGSNDIKNIWPQSWPEAREKDKVENYLHKEVCEDKISLEDAQKEISTDWKSIQIK